MQKLLVLSINLVFLVFSSFILGCTTTRETYDFQPKTYDEYYNAIKNSTIQFELIIADKRAVCYYTNDSTTFVYTIKHQYSNEYGYIYNTSLNELYCMENQVITEKKIKNEAENEIVNIFNNANFWFHLKYDYAKFEYMTTLKVCNRECDKFRFTETINGVESTFNIYIDKETGLCLKCVCIIEDSTAFYFEAKRFIYESNTQPYIQSTEEFNNKKNTQ